MIRLRSSETQFFEGLAKGLVPISRSLLQPIQGLQQLPHPHSTILGFMTDRLLKINNFVFSKKSVQIGRIEIEGVNRPTITCCKWRSLPCPTHSERIRAECSESGRNGRNLVGIKLGRSTSHIHSDSDHIPTHSYPFCS